MKNKNHYIILAIIAVVFVVLAVFTVDKKAQVEGVRISGPFFPDLGSDVDNIQAMAIQKDAKQAKVILEGDKWIIPEKFNYPVEAAKIRNMILSAASYRIIEKKTDNPDRFKFLGLENTDKVQEDGKATRITFMDKSGTIVYADYIKGAEGRSGRIEDGSSLYVRNANENQAYLVRAEFKAPMSFHEILSQSVYHIDSERIARATFIRPDGNRFETARSDKGQDFKIVGNEKDIKDPVQQSFISTVLEGAFIIGDVLPEDYKEFSKDKTYRNVYKTFDGLEVTVRTIYLGGEYWVKISASGKDAAKEEADIINSYASPWVYRVGEKTGRLLTIRLSDLVKEEK